MMSDATRHPTYRTQPRSNDPKGVEIMDVKSAKTRRDAPLATPTDLTSNATQDVSAGLNLLLADMFALYVKTKNFHWHMSGPHFRDYHLLLDEQSAEIFTTTDDLAERVRKIGGATLRSIGHIARLQRVADNDADYVTPLDMLAELRDDNKQLVAHLRATHDVCDEHGDVASASLLENWIDEAERRTWFLFETTRHGESAGH
jgi:starvation-inducible DNA-binding protein